MIDLEDLDEPLPDATREPTRPSGTKHRLVGVPYPWRPTERPDSGILADPVVWCRKCGKARVLPELRERTGGLCWECAGEK